ncbi:cytochrome c oxidase assembly factor 3, mitochondrial [Neodiprion pinetum]|uniref:Cytochrome c oxidase assembly factor 3 n=1 Tax=Neodiprion lecontei TaxID=441921 RepID=A0A6J0BPL6_NEOLC|nr:cytochrome c oxidase assembly factor 3, mitochondrial [Neodiprion lecontei]XP_046423584.1 cytochrome c oxidase assembly factor 3, mitochondrial [Neodiprion fabricii]XP_046480495.1 cytochrome c oxidase assembly factor 3, mitochondrial [Neodiprion pinetum]XP_046616630.1 cytochrome c oxidase assembly factor 3, mitochondrial [Neodiprion virginianus]
MADEQMPKIHEGKNFRKLTLVEQEYMRLIEERNLERVASLKRMQRNNRYTGLALGALVLGIYGYSMYAVRQENFLDDFEEPVKTTE